MRSSAGVAIDASLPTIDGRGGSRLVGQFLDVNERSLTEAEASAFAYGFSFVWGSSSNLAQSTARGS
jgi:hypothetical protein